MTDCPRPDQLLEALADDHQPLLDHVASCPVCGRDPELQRLLATWRQLEILPEIAVSAKFRARLQARIAASEARSRQWRRLDGLFDWLHLPALVALICLVFWLPPVHDQQLSQRLEWKPPPLEAPRRQLSGEPVLRQLRYLYQTYQRSRRNQG